MKSAYEIAMERLAAEGAPQKQLTEDEKRRIADIEKAYEARIAETKLTFESKLATAEAADAVKLREEMALELKRLEDEREGRKDAIWRGESPNE